MRPFLTLCGVASGLAAAFWFVSGLGRAGGPAGGLVATIDFYLASAAFGSMVLCLFGANVVELMRLQEAHLARVVKVLNGMESRSLQQPPIISPEAQARPVIQTNPTADYSNRGRREPKL